MNEKKLNNPEDKELEKSYKDTLNLPVTSFPMKADLPKKEPIYLQNWKDTEIYKTLRQKRKNNEKFVLHDGPPYANGDIHLGHSVNKILKDLINKTQILNNKDIAYVPGWDCHGLPIEHKVEGKFGRVNQKLDANEFRNECRKYAEKFIVKQKEDFTRLGILADWDNPYKSMDFEIEANTLRALSQIIQKGYLIAGDKPVYWCFDCKSALAEAEVEYHDKKSDSIDIAFPVHDIKRLNSLTGLNLESISFLVWTTTPWTLPANQGVSINKEFTYVIFYTENSDRYYIAEKSLLDHIIIRYGWKYTSMAEISGQLLDNLTLNHCYEDRQINVMLGDHVTNDAGTGIVHTAGAHGVEDFNVCRKYDQKPYKVMNSNGVYHSEIPVVGGKHVLKSNQIIIDHLTKCGNLVHHEEITHSYPHCWRHKTQLIFQATPQYFIKLSGDELNDLVFDEISKVSWLPSWGKERMKAMVGNRPDWCISRQRTWGTPIAIVVHRETGEFHPELENIMEEVAKRIEKKGINAWFDLELNELGIDESIYTKINDVLDVWFDSGMTHLTVMNHRNDLYGATADFQQADVYLEGGDQYRGWFQSSLLTSVLINGKSPYKAVMSHGMTVDENGQKMSKSLGNVISPQEIINEFGADILRLWVTSLDYSAELPISKEIIKRVVDIYRRIRNTSRYLLANLHDFDAEKNIVPIEQMVEIDAWILHEAHKTQKKIKELFNKYDFTSSMQLIHEFCSKSLGSVYLDVLKDRQYTIATDSHARRSGQSAMYHLIHAINRWIMPTLSFTAEEIWQHIPKQHISNNESEMRSILLSTWYTELESVEERHINEEVWDLILKIKDQVNSRIEEKRREGLIGSSLEANVELKINKKSFDLISDRLLELRFLLIVSQLDVSIDDKITDDEILTEAQITVNISKASKQKCARCWHYVDLSINEEHKSICPRCEGNITSQVETRQYF